MQGIVLVAAGTLASAVGTRLIARRRPVAGTALVAGVGSTAQMLSYMYIGESTSAAMGGLVTFWTVVLARWAGEKVGVKTWIAAATVMAGSAVVVLASPPLLPPSAFPIRTFYVGAVLCGVIITHKPTHRVAAAAMPGIVAGFTDTCGKAFDFAEGHARVFWGIAALVFATVQIVLLHAALRRFGERAINPTYMLVLMMSVVIVGSVSYGEFDNVGAEHVVGFTIGVSMSAAGSYFI